MKIQHEGDLENLTPFEAEALSVLDVFLAIAVPLEDDLEISQFITKYNLSGLLSEESFKIINGDTILIGIEAFISSLRAELRAAQAVQRAA